MTGDSFNHNIFNKYTMATPKTYTLTTARTRALLLIRNAPLTEDQARQVGIRSDVLALLQEAGWVKFRPYGKPPTYAVTAAGRAMLKA